MTSALRLRHAMMPYLYTMNRRAAFDNEPLVQPLYWDYPEIEAAYELTDEFRFGTELLVAPIVDPADAFRAACEVPTCGCRRANGSTSSTVAVTRLVRPNGRRLEAWRASRPHAGVR
ncbi:MAG: hypothetical protein V9G11_02805 [Bifidobacterium adolescentis]